MTDAELSHLLVLDAGPGPALTISAADAAVLIDAALDGAGFGPGGGGGGRAGEGGPSGGGSAGTGGGGSIAVGTKLAIVLGIAVVAIVVALLVWRGQQRNTVPLATPAIDSAVIDVATATGGAEPAKTATLDDAATSAVDDAMIEIANEEPSPPPRDKRDKPIRDKPTNRDKPSEADTDDLLGEANAKRAAKQWRESDALYARVAAKSPNSLAAQTAWIASASLHLEHLGDPKGAAQRFRRALAIAPAGSLAEDARWGLAEAARASHDNAAEAAALDEFLAHHGSSPLAPNARARRAELP